MCPFGERRHSPGLPGKSTRPVAATPKVLNLRSPGSCASLGSLTAGNSDDLRSLWTSSPAIGAPNLSTESNGPIAAGSPDVIENSSLVGILKRRFPPTARHRYRGEGQQTRPRTQPDRARPAVRAPDAFVGFAAQRSTAVNSLRFTVEDLTQHPNGLVPTPAPIQVQPPTGEGGRPVRWSTSAGAVTTLRKRLDTLLGVNSGMYSRSPGECCRLRVVSWVLGEYRWAR